MKDKGHIIRFYILSVLLWGVAVGLFVRLFYIQILQSAEYRARAVKQVHREVVLEAERGVIYDRNMNPMAVDLRYAAFGANPSRITNPGKVAAVFAKFSGKSSVYYRRRIAKEKSFVWLERKVPLQQADEILLDQNDGITRTYHYLRFYPYGSVAGKTIGFTNIDNVGLSGVELQLNKILTGVNGHMQFKTDAWGRQYPDPNSVATPPIKGRSVLVTIDLKYQQIVEEELARAVVKANARSGKVIVLNPKTGDILAMACSPPFDPNFATSSSPHHRKNTVITDTFEPGSTFKIVTAAAALTEVKMNPEDSIFCENGRIQIGTHTIRDTHPYGWLTFRQVIENSSNIGTIRIAQILSSNTLYRYGRNFGFGNISYSGLIGEVKGILRAPHEWSGLSLAEIAIGQEVTVTAVQLASAYGVIANGGILMKPRLIQGILNTDGTLVRRFAPEEIRKVIPEAVADSLTSFLLGAVERGTGKRAQIDGLQIAGKTGTAQKPDPRGGYSSANYIASFIGIHPVQDPKLVCLVVIDSPKGAYYGGVVAAPAYRNIIHRINNLPTDQSESVTISSDQIKNYKPLRRSPDVRNIGINEAREQLRHYTSSIIVKGEGHIVYQQTPPPGLRIHPNDPIVLNVSIRSPQQQKLVATPDVRGLSIRKAMNALARRGFKTAVDGSGKVRQQWPPPGQKVKQGMLCKLLCKPD